jgi:hypothetical protein
MPNPSMNRQTTSQTANENPRTAEADDACPIVAVIMMISVRRYIDLRPFLSPR